MTTIFEIAGATDASLGYGLMDPDELAHWHGHYSRRLVLLDRELTEGLSAMATEDLTNLRPALLLYIAEHGLDQAVPLEELRAPTRVYLAHQLDVIGRELARREQAATLGVANAPRRYPDDFLRDLKRRVNLDGVVEQECGIALGRLAGGKRQASCPFCRAGTNCFTVYLADGDDQHYYCFRCGKHGDAIGLIQDVYGVPFRAAVEILAARCGVTPPEPPRPAGSPPAAPDWAPSYVSLKVGE